MKHRFAIILYVISWAIRIAIKMRWWNLVYRMVEYKKKRLAAKMRNYETTNK